jgi:hypothetical protein
MLNAETRHTECETDLKERKKFCKNKVVSLRSPSLFYLLVHSRCRGCLFSLDHTQTHITVGRTPLDEGSARCRDLYLTTQPLYKRQTSIPPAGFEPTIPVSARPQSYALDRAATGTGVKKRGGKMYVDWKQQLRRAKQKLCNVFRMAVRYELLIFTV